MKKLWIVRHAKSSWSHHGLADHDRPLNGRGKRDAPAMGQIILENYIVPDVLITSTAKRARATCKQFRKAFGIDKNQVVKTRELYHASVAACIETIMSIDNEFDSAAIFGHNPTFTYLIHELTGQGPDNLPTCGCALVSSDAVEWKDFEAGNCRLEQLIFPKQFIRENV